MSAPSPPGGYPQVYPPPAPPGFKAPPMPPGFKAPPMPPGFKMPPMPPMPPGFKMPPAPPMPPGGPRVPAPPPHFMQGQYQNYPVPPPQGGHLPPGVRFPQMPPRPPGVGPEQDQGQGYMVPPGGVRVPRDDYNYGVGAGMDSRGYPIYSSEQGSQGYYGGVAGPGVDHRHSRREEEPREPTNTVWVGNLDMQRHTDEFLRKEFREFGRVIRIAKVPDKSYCFVHFRLVEEARNAVETLSARGSLGGARFSYGKMFNYSQDEGGTPVDGSMPSQGARANRRPRDDDRTAENEDRRRRHRRDEEPMEPTNVLWIGDLPPSITNEELNENFKVFGNILNISRLDTKNMAFVHFETVESCTQALDLMRDQLICGVRVALNYGRAQRNPTSQACGVSEDGIPLSETPTNVIFIGQFATDVTEEDVEALFEPFEGFISSKFIHCSCIAFGHFDTVEHARIARVALSNALLKGAPMRISFGKNSHTMTMADRVRRGRPAPLVDGVEVSWDGLAASGARGGLDGTSGALVAGPGVGGSYEGGVVVSVPAMGAVVNASPVSQVHSSFTRERPAPDITLDVRLQSLLGASYNSCGEAEKSLSPSIIQTVCDLIDDCVDEASEKRLDDTIFLYTPLNSAHVFGILAKRMHSFFNDDPHKKLYIVYAATRVLLGARTDYIFFTKAALNAYLMVLFVASQGQTNDGMELLVGIIENVRHHSFIENQRLDAEYVEVFRGQLEEILGRAKEEQDLTSLIAKKRRR